MSDTAAAPRYTSDDYIPARDWGRDHWSMLGYMETVMVECAGFQVGFDPCTRANRRHFRVLREECPKPKRPVPASSFGYAVMPPGKYGTRLADGSEVDGHDDWCCVQDMAEAGLLAVTRLRHKKPMAATAGDVQPGNTLHLSDLGQQVAAALRAHKATGGAFGDFRWSPPAPPAGGEG